MGIDAGQQVHQRGAAIRDVCIPPAVGLAGHGVDRRQRRPRLHVMVGDDHDDGVRPPADQRVEQLPDQPVRLPVASLGRLTLGALVVSDGVGFVEVAENQAQAVIGDGIHQVGMNRGVHRIAVRIQRDPVRDDPARGPSPIGGPGAE